MLRRRSRIGIARVAGFPGGVEHRQQHAKHRFARLRFTFDDAAVVADDLGDQRKAKAAAGQLGGDERIEQVRHQVVGHARPVVLDAEFERQRHPRRLARHRQADAGAERSGELDLRLAFHIGRRLGGVLHQIEKHLNELILIGQNRRQRGVVVLDETDVAGKARLRQPFDVIEHRMDVDRAALHRTLVAEHLHAIDQRDDAVGLVADQPRQRAVLRRGRLLQKLRRAANAGQRILDLMRQHRRKRGDGARSAAMGELAVHLVGDGALLHHHHDMAGLFGHRRNMQIDQLVDADARRAEIDLVFVDGRADTADLLDQFEHGTAERHQLLQRLSLEMRDRGLEEGFRCHVGIDDLAVRCDQQQRVGQCVEHGIPQSRRSCGMVGKSAHAAALHANSSNASRSARRTCPGSSLTRMVCRQRFNVSVDAVAASAATSSVQPRCLRA
jgi:hypothetical protein